MMFGTKNPEPNLVDSHNVKKIELLDISRERLILLNMRRKVEPLFNRKLEHKCEYREQNIVQISVGTKLSHFSIVFNTN